VITVAPSQRYGRSRPGPGPGPGLPGRKRQPGRQGPDPAALTGQSRTPGGTGAARGDWRGRPGQAAGMMPARRETSLHKSRTHATGRLWP